MRVNTPKKFVISSAVVVIIGLLLFKLFSPIDRQIVIGAIMPLTGNRAEYGQDASEALQMAVDGYRERFKAFDCTLSLDLLDSKSTVAGSLVAYQSIMSRHPSCKVVFTQGSSIAGAVSNFAKKDGVIQISNAGNTLPTKTNPNFFSCSIDENSSARMFCDAIKSNTSCLAYYLDDDLGKSVFFEMQKICRGGELRLVGVPYMHETDARALVEKNRSIAFDCYVIIGLGPNLTRIVRALREAGVKSDIWCPETMLTDGNKKQLAGMTAGLHCLSTTSLPVEIKKAFRERFGKEVLSISHTTVYDAACLVLESYLSLLEQGSGIDEVQLLKEEMLRPEIIGKAPGLSAIISQAFVYKMEFLPL